MTRKGRNCMVDDKDGKKRWGEKEEIWHTISSFSPHEKKKKQWWEKENILNGRWQKWKDREMITRKGRYCMADDKDRKKKRWGEKEEIVWQMTKTKRKRNNDEKREKLYSRWQRWKEKETMMKKGRKYMADDKNGKKKITRNGRNSMADDKERMKRNDGEKRKKLYGRWRRWKEKERITRKERN